MANLMIFIDGLPFEKLKRMSFLNSLNKCRVIPSLGFSIAAYSRMFLGKTPDEAGVFMNYVYDSQNSDFVNLKKYVGILSALDKVLPIAVGLRRIITAETKKRTETIPLRFLPFFKENDDSFIFNSKQSVFRKFREKGGMVVEAIGKKGKRNDVVLNLALRHLDESLFLVLPDFDYFGHIYGPDSKAYVRKLAELDGKIEELTSKFKAANEDAKVTIFSDHGMSTVRRKIYLKLEKNLGGKCIEDYIYFKDGVILRVWTFKHESFKEIREFLKTQRYGKILTEKERLENGIRSRRFGNIIFVLPPGSIFSPSFYGIRAPRGMHGYLPTDRNQYGFLTSDSYDFKQEACSSEDVYGILWDLLKSGG